MSNTHTEPASTGQSPELVVPDQRIDQVTQTFFGHQGELMTGLYRDYARQVLALHAKS